MTLKMALGIDAFNTEREYTDFDEKKMGFGINTQLSVEGFQHAVFRRRSGSKRSSDRMNWRATRRRRFGTTCAAGVSYELTHENINNIDPTRSDVDSRRKGHIVNQRVTPEHQLRQPRSFF